MNTIPLLVYITSIKFVNYIILWLIIHKVVFSLDCKKLEAQMTFVTFVFPTFTWVMVPRRNDERIVSSSPDQRGKPEFSSLSKERKQQSSFLISVWLIRVCIFFFYYSLSMDTLLPISPFQLDLKQQIPPHHSWKWKFKFERWSSTKIYLFSHSNIFSIFHRGQTKFFLSMDFIWETKNKTVYIKIISRVQNVSENSKSHENFDISKI